MCGFEVYHADLSDPDLSAKLNEIARRILIVNCVVGHAYVRIDIGFYWSYWIFTGSRYCLTFTDDPDADDCYWVPKLDQSMTWEEAADCILEWWDNV